MNLKRVSCIGALSLAAIIFVIFMVVFFFVLGKVISGKEIEEPEQTSTRNKSFTKLIVNKDCEHNELCYVLYIPSIDLQQTIVHNIDPTNKSQYLPVIENNVAHGKFTYTPEEVFKNQNGITYLFSHQNSHSDVFKNLDKVKDGNIIYVKYKNDIYSYSVTSKILVSPTDTESYTSSSPLPLLRLQTCANGISQRLIVDAKLEGIV